MVKLLDRQILARLPNWLAWPLAVAIAYALLWGLLLIFGLIIDYRQSNRSDPPPDQHDRVVRWTSDAGAEYVDHYRAGAAFPFHRSVTVGGTSRSGDLTESGKPHGRWVWHTPDPSNRPPDQWFWYGDEITEGDWMLRNR